MTPVIPGIRIQRSLGEGACGEVFHGVRDGGVLCAVKLLNPRAINRDYLSYCLTKMIALKGHSAVLPVLDYNPGTALEEPYYVMAFAAERRGADGGGPLTGRTLERWCGEMENHEAWRILGEIADGVAWLHKHAIVHCNLKPSNVFLTNEEPPHAQIADVGQGWLTGVEEIAIDDHVCYGPPEQLRTPEQIQYGMGEKWDVYAFGVLAWHLLTGDFPRGHDVIEGTLGSGRGDPLPEPAAFADHIEAEPAPQWPAPPVDELDAARRAVIDKCLQLRPLDRWVDMREVRDALHHAEREAAGALQLREAQAAEKLRATSAPPAAAPPVPAAAAPSQGPAPAPAPVQQEPVRTTSRPAPASSGQRRLPVSLPLAASLVFGGLAAVGALALGISAKRLASGREQDAVQAKATQTRLQGELKAKEAELDAARSEARQLGQGLTTARQNLLEAQSSADHFFESFLEASRQLPASATQERARLMVNAYDYFTGFMQKAGDKPELAESKVRALGHLAEIKLSMATSEGGAKGLAEAAQKYDEARAGIDAVLKANPAHPDAAALRIRSADYALMSAQLQLESGQQPEVARRTLTEASAALDAAAPREAAPPEIIRRQARAQYWLARSLSESEANEAANLLARAADMLNGLLADEKNGTPADKLALAQVNFERAVLERRARKIEAALETQVAVAEILLQCLELPNASWQLALSYGETGEMLDGNGERKDSFRAHGAAIRHLSELHKTQPGRADVSLQLAARYSDYAQIIREAAEPARAQPYAQGAVLLLQELVERDPGNIRYAGQLASKKARYSELLIQTGKKPEGLKEAREAISLMEKLNVPGTPATSEDFDFRLNLAQTYGAIGKLSEAARQKEDAITCYTRAVSAYETLSTARAGDDAIERGLAMSRVSLSKLKTQP